MKQPSLTARAESVEGENYAVESCWSSASEQKGYDQG